jgi:exopolyphosphatase/guanosine-5'-triphosphate,3'-diphosphate pyrophosphatase
MNPNKESGITRQGLEALKLALLEAGNIQNLRLNGLRSDRTPVMAGGLAIMLAVFETLDIEHMIYADGALRQGVLYDLRGRLNLVEDLRPETVRQLQRRYQIGLPQANRVEKLAMSLFDQLAVEAPAKRTEEDRLFLGWAAELHEIGWAISHTSYHKHGAYILTYADMPGFSRPEQAKLASLILGHRGKLSKLLQLSQDKRFCRMLLALRLAVLFCRARMHSQVAPHIAIQSEKNGYRLSLPAAWLNAHPLTHANLVEEAAYWQGVEVRLALDCN